MLYQPTRSMGQRPSPIPGPVAPIGQPRPYAPTSRPQYQPPQYPNNELVSGIPMPKKLPIGGGGGIGPAPGGGKWPWESPGLPPRPWAEGGGGETEIGPSPKWQEYHESIKPRPPMFAGIPRPGSKEDLRRKQAMWEYQKKLQEWQAMKEEDWHGKMPGEQQNIASGSTGAPRGGNKKIQGLVIPKPPANIPYRGPHVYG